ENELNEKIAAIDFQLKVDMASDAAWELIENEKLIRQQPLKVVTDFYHTKRKSEKNQQQPATEAEKENSKLNSVDTVLKSIEKAIDTVENLPGFQTIINDLERKKNRLTQRSYTIALFGAFSAGKSSFANALLGDKVLP